jgi:hypothetical protein
VLLIAALSSFVGGMFALLKIALGLFESVHLNRKRKRQSAINLNAPPNGETELSVTTSGGTDGSPSSPNNEPTKDDLKHL